jgi:hypothetical protein
MRLRMQVLASDQRYDAIVAPGGPGSNPPKWPVMAGGSPVTGRDADPLDQRCAALRRHRLPKARSGSAEMANHGQWEPCDGPGRGPRGGHGVAASGLGAAGADEVADFLVAAGSHWAGVFGDFAARPAQRLLRVI